MLKPAESVGRRARRLIVSISLPLVSSVLDAKKNQIVDWRQGIEVRCLFTDLLTLGLCA